MKGHLKPNRLNAVVFVLTGSILARVFVCAIADKKRALWTKDGVVFH
jgi:hypothetical protein